VDITEEPWEAAVSMPSTKRLPPLSPSKDKSHHKGHPPTGFINPWPSYPAPKSFIQILKTRLSGHKPPYVPVPADRAELVQVLEPDWSPPEGGKAFKVTWIGHASFLLQCAIPNSKRTLNILLDPVFSERTSPFSFYGPRRYTPTPCTLQQLLDSVPIDVVCISHNHYDHADASTLRTLHESRGSNVVYCVALGNTRWLLPLGIPKDRIWEADWWDRIAVSLSASADMLEKRASGFNSSSEKAPATGSITITCTPCQHSSARSPFDKDVDLWCSFAIESSVGSASTDSHEAGNGTKIYFSGDTGYRTIPETPDAMTEEEVAALPICPAFEEIGTQLGPFDLALLPIGLCHPRAFMSPVHCNSTDSLCVHRDVRAKRSMGMHYGTVRGGLSEFYEDVRLPPREWREEADKHGLKWREGDSEDWEAGLMSVGESIII
jgi:N-acyl-phosphatidylethanolamine-hydrolysing phospholipase D